MVLFCKVKKFFLAAFIHLAACAESGTENGISQEEADSILKKPGEEQCTREFNKQSDSLWTHACVLDSTYRSPGWVAAGRWKSNYSIETDSEPQTKDIIYGRQRFFVKIETPENIIFKLFPGQKYMSATGEKLDGELQMILWTCNQCPKDSLRYWGSTEWNRDVFPRELNNTVIDTVFITENKGIKYKLISFYHLAGWDHIGGGRFVGVPMGIALIKQNKTNQELVVFAPYLGTYGSFQYPILPALTWINNTLFITYNFANGGPGAPYTAYKEIFMIKHDRAIRVGEYDFVAFFNSVAGEWYTETKFISSGRVQNCISGVVAPCIIMENYPWAIESAYPQFKLWMEANRHNHTCYKFSLVINEKIINDRFINTGPTSFKADACK